MKERIIGAVVLVVFVVLVVPIFLDGPADETNIVSERVLLPGQEPQDTKVVVLDRERSVPIPAASSNEPAAASTAEEAPVESRDPEPKPIVKPIVTEDPPVQPASTNDSEAPPKPALVADTVSAAPAAASSAAATSSETGMWAVQLGSFSNKDNAETLAANLRKQGYAAFLSKLNNAGKELHRVRIGPQKDRQSAEAMATRLAKVGHTGQVLPHP